MRGRFIIHVRESAARVPCGHGQTELGHGRMWGWESKKEPTDDQEIGKIAKRTSVPQMTRLYREWQPAPGLEKLGVDGGVCQPGRSLNK